jgi:hypothetical protein
MQKWEIANFLTVVVATPCEGSPQTGGSPKNKGYCLVIRATTPKEIATD